MLVEVIVYKNIKKIKEQIPVHVKDLLKKIHDEEQDLQKQLDTRIELETEKIAVTEREENYLQKSKAAVDAVADKYREESNQMVLLKMHKDYLASAPLWKGRLEANAGRFNAKKEEELHFYPTNPGKNDSLVGTLADKNVNIHSSKGAKHTDQPGAAKSRSCTIL